MAQPVRMVHNGRMRHHSTSSLLAALALTVAVTGCGGGTETSDTTPPGAAEVTASPVTDAPSTGAPTTPPETTSSPETTTGHADHSTDMGDTSDTSLGDADRVVTIVMTDLAFAPDHLEVSAGETIRFAVSNEGALVHEFRLSNAHRIEEHLASGHEDHGDDGHHEDGDVVLELEAGETGEMTVTFSDDETLFTEIACLIPGHYEAGMKAPLAYR